MSSSSIAALCVSKCAVALTNTTGQSSGPEPGAGCDFTPHPDYWVALLWRRLMGRRVLPTPTVTYPKMGADNSTLPKTLRLHAHCTAGTSNGSVSVVWANMDESKTYVLNMSESNLGGIRSDPCRHHAPIFIFVSICARGGGCL